MVRILILIPLLLVGCVKKISIEERKKQVLQKAEAFCECAKADLLVYRFDKYRWTVICDKDIKLDNVSHDVMVGCK